MLPSGDETLSVSADELMEDLKNECKKYEQFKKLFLILRT